MQESEDEYGLNHLRDNSLYLSFPQFDNQFNGFITRSTINAYEDTGTPVDRILSGGAGKAEYEKTLADETEWEVKAIDIDSSIVKKANEGNIPSNLEISLGDIAHPVRDEQNSYDVNLQANSLQELVGPEINGMPNDYLLQGLEGVKNSLRPGGLALIAVPRLKDALAVLEPESIKIEEETLQDSPIAYAEMEMQNGDLLYQYCFRCEASRFEEAIVDKLEFDPYSASTLNEIAEASGLEPASTDPVEEWFAENYFEEDGNRYDVNIPILGNMLDVPADASSLIGSEDLRLQDIIVNFESDISPLSEIVHEEGITQYRMRQLTDTLPPRVPFYVFENPG